MKNFLTLSAVAAVLVASATFASADTIVSNSSSTTYLGFNGTVGSGLTYTAVTGGTAYDSAHPGATYNLTPGTTWAPAIGGTSWVSNNPNSAPNGSYVAPGGDYVYSTTFTTTTGGDYEGTLSLMADDTVAVYLNNVLIVPAGLVGADNDCSAALPTCTVVDTVGLGSFYDPSFNSDGVNTLTFVVEQTGAYSEGLDYSASISSVPEPSTLMLLGTGLLGSAGAIFRRKRS